MLSQLSYDPIAYILTPTVFIKNTKDLRYFDFLYRILKYNIIHLPYDYLNKTNKHGHIVRLPHYQL